MNNEEKENELRDCYYSPTQYKMIKIMMRGKMDVSLNGQPVSQMYPHGSTHELLSDEVFVGTAKLKDITCVEHW